MHVGELPGDSGKVKERWMCPMENCQAIVQRLDDHLQGSHGLKRQYWKGEGEVDVHVGELPGNSGKVKERWMCTLENCQAIVER